MTATPPPPQDPQGQPPRFQAIRDLARQGPAPVKFSAIRDIAKQRASEADGFLENVGLQTLGALKTFGDAVVNVAALAVKAGSGAVSAVSGGSFGQGYDQATQGFQEAYGTGDPGLFELLHIPSAESAMYQAYPMGRTAPQGTVGQQTDAYLRAKLGRSAIIGETIGHLASFVIGPGALAGRAGSGVARQVINFTEKSVSRMASLRAGVAKGGLWEQIAAMPKWKQTLARLPGNYMANTLSASANLMAASYATAKDSDRLASAKAVASTAWILAPAAKVGQQIEAAILSRAIGPEGANVARQALARWQAGEMSAQALDATIRGLTSTWKGVAARGLATGISSFGESLMFLGADPHIHDLYSQAMKGDPNAIADLTMMFASNWAGLAVAKGIVPHDQAGLLKTLRPDYNKLSSYLEAQAVKEVQEPAGPRSKDEMAKDLEQTLQDFSQEPKPGESRDPWNAWEQARQEWVQKMDVQWAEVPADAAIKSGWEPRATGNGVLELTFSPRFSARMERGEVSRNQPSFLPQDPTGPIRLDLGAAEHKALRDVGVELPEGPLTDQAAQYALESLTMLGMFRKLQADVAFQKMGLREIEPGVYASDYEGKQVRIDLDGKVLERDALGTEPWKVSENQTLDYGLDMSQAQWANETEQGLAMMLAQKQAIAPDTLVDGILTYVLAESQAGNSIGAQQIREFLANTPLDQLVASIKPGEDRALAMELGRIAMGHDNAQNALQQRAQKAAEVQAQQAVEGAGREGEKGSIINPVDVGVAAVDAAVEGAVATADKARMSRDYATKPQAQVLSDLVPDAKFPYEGRQVDSRSAQLYGEFGPEVRKARKVGRKIERLIPAEEVIPEAKGLDMKLSRGRMIADKRIEVAEGSREARFQESVQKAAMRAWEQVRQSGGFQVREGKVEPMRERDQSVMTYEVGRDAADVMRDDTLRPQYFKDLVQINPDAMVQETKTVKRKDGTEIEVPVYEGKGKDRKVKMRRMTGEDLEQQYVKERAERIQSGVTAQQADVDVATEFVREFKNRPDVWRGKEMLDPNAMSVLDKMLRKQSAAAAVNEVWGPDMPKGVKRDAVIADLKARAEADPADKDVARLLQKLQSTGGVEGALRQFGADVAKGIKDRTREAEAMAVARNYAQRIQKAEPIKLGPRMRKLRDFISTTSQIMAYKAGLYDPGETVFRPAAYFRVLDMAKALGSTIANPGEAIRYAEDMGFLIRDSGDLVLSEAKGFGQKIADFINEPSKWAEKFKGAVVAKVVDMLVERVKSGEMRDGDVPFLRDILKLSPQAMADIGGRRISDALVQQIRRESTIQLTNRATSSEGSRMAADPRAATLVRFTRFATSRLESVFRSMVSVAKSETPAEFRASLWRATKVLTSLSASGAVAKALALMFSELFKSGDPIAGLERWWATMKYQPAWEMAKAGALQALGGPFAALFGVIAEGEPTGRQVLKLTVPGEAIALTLDAIEALREMDAWKMGMLLVDAGVVPAGREAANLIQMASAYAVGADPIARRDDAVIRQFEKIEGMEPTYGSRNKPDAFYDALNDLMPLLKSAGTDAERQEKVMEHLRRALEVAPSESVAASIEARARVMRLSPENLAKFIDFVNDDAMVSRIAQRELNIKAFAKMVRKMEGTQMTQWESELELVAAQAVKGFGNHWDDLVDRALDETSQRMVTREPEGSQLRDLAEAMAPFQDQWGNVMTEKQIRQVARIRQSSERARRIYGILRERARGRRDKIRQESRKN